MLRYIAAALTAALAMPAAAQDWAYAESNRFRVYSEGGEAAARTMAVKLERLDDAMRLFTGVKPPPGPTPVNGKVTLYQFGKSDDIGKLAGQRGVYGFFIPRAGDSVAFVPLVADRISQEYSSPGARQSFEFNPGGIDPEAVLFHEYAHYFMYYHKPAAYPLWYSEGFAELFGTLRLEDRGFALGEAPIHRRTELTMFDVSTDKMFDTRSQMIDFPPYGHGWLAVSYLTFKPERKGQLAKYLIALNRGVEGKKAAQEAFGDLGNLQREFNAYRRERAMGMSAQYPSQSEPMVSVRKLSAAEAAAMPTHIKSSAGVTREEARGIVKDARRIATQYPDSLPVQLMTLEAEFDANDMGKADKRAVEILRAHPNSVEAHLFRAMIAMENAKLDPKFLANAREHYLAANKIDAEQPQALAGYYLSFRLANEAPPENALIALETAFGAAPFDSQIRRMLGHLLLLENKDAQAKAVLGPLAYRPHANARTRKLRDLLAGLDRGERQPLIDELAPSLKKKDAD